MAVQYEFNARLSNKIRNMGIMCAFLVVVIHCRPDFELGSSGWWVKELLEDGITHIAVPFFFVVSGFMLARELNGIGYRSAVYKRLRTLLIPFFFWNLSFYVFDYAIGNVSNFMHNRPFVILLPSLKDLGLWYTGLPMLTPLWYVRAIFVMCMISPILLWGVRKLGVFFLGVLLLIYALICPFVPLPNYGRLEEFARVGVLPVLGLFYFSVGVAIHENRIPAFSLPRPSVSLIIGALLVVIRALLVYFKIPYTYYVGFASVPFAIYGVWGLVSSSEWPGWIVKSSFGVYVIHKFILALIVLFVNTSHSAFSYLGTSILAFGVSLGLVVLMKKTMPRVSLFVFGGR